MRNRPNISMAQVSWSVLVLVPLFLSSACGRITYDEPAPGGSDGSGDGGGNDTGGNDTGGNGGGDAGGGDAGGGDAGGGDAGGGDVGGGADFCVLTGAQAASAWPFDETADAYLERFWNRVGGGTCQGCHPGVSTSPLDIPADAAAAEANLATVISTLWPLLQGATPSTTSPLTGGIWRHHPDFPTVASPEYPANVITEIDNLINDLATCANATGSEPPGGGGNPGPGPGAGVDPACVNPAAAVDGWPFEESDQAYLDEFWTPISAAGGCACHSGVEPTFGPDSGATGIGVIRPLFAGADTSDTQTGGIWAHLEGSPNYNPGYTYPANAISALDSIVTKIQGCAGN